jgi:hypothetical protein
VVKRIIKSVHQGSKWNQKRLKSGGESLQASRKCARQEVKKWKSEKRKACESAKQWLKR